MRFACLTTSIALLFLLLTLSGCLTSTTSFYLPSQVIQDDRLIGTYVDKRAGHSWEITKGDRGRGKGTYIATLRQGEAWSSYILTLFKLDGRTYFDLFPENDASIARNPGGPPTSSMIMRYLTNQPLHLISQIKITDQHLEITTINREGLGRLMRMKPEMGVSYDSRWLLKGTTQQLQKLLREISDNPDIFNEHIQLQRDEKLIREQSKTYQYSCAACRYQGDFSPIDVVDRGHAYRVRCAACGYEFSVEKDSQ